MTKIESAISIIKQKGKCIHIHCIDCPVHYRSKDCRESPGAESSDKIQISFEYLTNQLGIATAKGIVMEELI